MNFATNALRSPNQGDQSIVGIRRLRAREWKELKQLRLRALADAPDAFSFTLAEAQRQTDEEWQTFAAPGSAGERRSTFVAEVVGRFVGMAIGYLPETTPVSADDPEAVHLIAMWVEPAMRRQGVGTALTKAVVGWAVERGSKSVRLGVNATNTAAIALYASRGFQDTGKRQDLFNEGDQLTMEMERQPQSKTVIVRIDE